MSEVDVRSQLISSILAQAKLFLEDANEFYPFGTAIGSDLSIIPIAVYSEEEHPSSGTLMNELEIALTKGIVEGNYIMAAIAADARINKSNTATDVVAITIYERSEQHNIYYNYFEKEEKIYFEEIKLD